MRPADASKILAKCVAYDNRQVTAETVRAWGEALDDMPLADALAIVTRHYAASRDWIMPSDINSAWHAIKRERLAAIPQAERATPPQDLEGRDYLAFLRAQTRAITRGALAPAADQAAYEAVGRAVPPPEQLTARPTHKLSIGRNVR